MDNENELVKIANDILEAASIDISNVGANALFKLPIAELATLGAGISSLIPTLRTVTETSTINTGGLYRLLNQSSGDVLKVAKGNTNNAKLYSLVEFKNKKGESIRKDTKLDK